MNFYFCKLFYYIYSLVFFNMFMIYYIVLNLVKFKKEFNIKYLVLVC